MSTTHSYAFVTGLPLTVTNLTPFGSVLTGCRIVSEITEEKEFRINLEDESESGLLKGELHDDLITRINLRVAILAATPIPELCSVVTIASASAFSNRYNGVWKIEKSGIAFKHNDRTEVSWTLKRAANLTYVAA